MAMSRTSETETKAGSKQNRVLSGVFSYSVIVVITVVVTLIAAITLGMILRHRAYVKASRNERDSLLEIAEALEVNTSNSGSGISASEIPDSYISPFDLEMRNINPDYFCWIRIDDTAVDYPVVRGSDNEKYLDVSFYGEKNRLGSLFLDYRCNGSNFPHLIIYGHNSREGDMFGGLKQLLNEQYLEEHPIITLKINDQIVEYEIFSARTTDTRDPAYFLDFSDFGSFREFLERNGAPEDAVQILTLSTCVSGNNPDERVIIQAALH